MVARGDLGVELSISRVPVIQKEIIHLANKIGKPVVTATQMLESMTHVAIPPEAIILISKFSISLLTVFMSGPVSIPSTAMSV